MKKDILIILPSRSNGTGRELNVERFIKHWQNNTEGYTALCVMLDDDDEHRYSRDSRVMYTVNPNVRFVPKVNRAALQFKGSYKYIANFSDDFIIRTKWESVFLEAFKQNNEVGILYGNDLLQYDKLPTAVCISSNIIDALGYMIPPQLEHMYADNFWKDLGQSTGVLKYFPYLIFEHLHPDKGKAVRDTQYQYAAAVANRDQHEYYTYINSYQYREDIQKINKLKEKLNGKV